MSLYLGRVALRYTCVSPHKYDTGSVTFFNYQWKLNGPRMNKRNILGLCQGLMASFNFGKSRRAFCVVTSITDCSDTPLIRLTYSAEIRMFLGSFLTCVGTFKNDLLFIIVFYKCDGFRLCKSQIYKYNKYVCMYKYVGNTPLKNKQKS